MTQTIHVQATVERDGEVHVANLPVKQGQLVELSIRIRAETLPAPRLTAQELLASDLIGMWKDRADIGDSLVFARQLRGQAQRRER